jgi:hypothetical protein
MNRLRKFVLLLPIAALVLKGCGGEHAEQDGIEGNATPGDEQVSDVAAPQSSPLLKPVQPQEPDASQGSPQQDRQRVMSDIVAMIGKPEGRLTPDDWTKIKDRYWLPDFDRIVRSTAEATTVRELLATPDGHTPLVVQLLSGSFETQIPAEKDALLAFHNLALVTAAMGGSSLPSAIGDRRNDPNITRGDVMMFEVFNDAFQDVPRSGEFPKTTLREWEQLAESPNDLVRLISLRTFSRVSPQPEEWINFYRSYVDDPSDEIIAEAADKIFETAMPEAAELLIEMRSRTDPPLSSEFAGKLDRAISFLSNLPARSQ